MNKVLYEVAFKWDSMYYGAGFVFVVALIFFLYHRKKRFELDTKMQVVWFFSGLIAVGALIAQIIMGKVPYFLNRYVFVTSGVKPLSLIFSIFFFNFL